MKKIHLDLDTLSVESFDTTTPAGTKGTVLGHDTAGGTTAGGTQHQTLDLDCETEFCSGPTNYGSCVTGCISCDTSYGSCATICGTCQATECGTCDPYCCCTCSCY